jgi:hypothetical protein
MESELSQVYAQIVEKYESGTLENTAELCAFGDSLLALLGTVTTPTVITCGRSVGYEYSSNKKVTVPFRVEIGVDSVSYSDTYGMSAPLNSGLDILVKKVKTFFVDGAETDDIVSFIETQCSKLGVYPVENCLSIETNQTDPALEPKHFCLNSVKYYDDDGIAIGPPKVNYELTAGEKWFVNLTVLNTTDHVQLRDSDVDQWHRLAKLSGQRYNLKLRSSRAFFNSVRAKWNTGSFRLADFSGNASFKIGIIESLDTGVLDLLPLEYIPGEFDAYQKKFTVTVL